MATSKKAQVDVLFTMREVLGMKDDEIRRSGNADALAALDAEQAEARKASMPKVAKLEEQAAAALKALLPVVGSDQPTPQVRADLLGLPLAELLKLAPSYATLVALTSPKAAAPRGSGDGARAEMAWSVLAGLAPKWLALNGKGKDGRQMKSGAVYYIAPALSADDNGEVVWRTSVLRSEQRSMSVALSQRGAIRPTMAGITAIQHAFGKLEEFAKATSTSDKPVTVNDLLTIAQDANIGYVDLGDLGDPATMSNEQLEKAFANREGLTYTRLVATK